MAFSKVAQSTFILRGTSGAKSVTLPGNDDPCSGTIENTLIEDVDTPRERAPKARNRL